MALFCLRRHTATAASLNNSVCVCESICQAVIAAFLECRLNSVTCNILWSVPFFGYLETCMYIFWNRLNALHDWAFIEFFSFCLFALCKARIPVITFSGDKLVQAGCLIAPPKRNGKSLLQDMRIKCYIAELLSNQHILTPFIDTC